MIKGKEKWSRRIWRRIWYEEGERALEEEKEGITIEEDYKKKEDKINEVMRKVEDEKERIRREEFGGTKNVRERKRK